MTLAVHDLTKTIGKRHIVQGISFEVRAGEVFGFLGPNGAGKTTTIRMLVGLMKPTSGRIVICGYSLRENFVHAMRYVGSIVENPALYPYMSGRENLQLVARTLGNVDPERIEAVVRQVDLHRRIDEKVKAYSLGMRQRLGIAQALLGKPRVLILDEPTNGLDPQGIRELRTFIRQLAKEQGISVLVSSHILSEIETMCDRFAIISHGRLVKAGSMNDLVEREHGSIEWDFNPFERGLSILQSFSDVTIVRQIDEHRVHVHMPFARVAKVNRALIEAGVEVGGIQRHEQTLEDLFMALTGEHRIG